MATEKALEIIDIKRSQCGEEVRQLGIYLGFIVMPLFLIIAITLAF